MELNGMDMNINKESVIIVDCDDVLFNISIKWFEKILEQRDFFSKYFYLPKVYDPERDYNNIMLRDNFYIDQFLLKKDVYNSISDEEKNLLKQKFFEIYLQPDFYDDLEPTKFAKGLAFTATQRTVKEIVVVSRTYDENKKSKEKAVTSLFSNVLNKVSLYFLKSDEKKSDYINSLNCNVDVIIDDELSNIEDIIVNCKRLDKIDIIIPHYGHNNPTEDLELLVKDKNINILYAQVL